MGEVTYPFHPEASAPVHHFEEFLVFLAAEEVQTSNLKVTPEVAHIILFSFHGFWINFRDALRESFLWKSIVSPFLLILPK